MNQKLKQAIFNKKNALIIVLGIVGFVTANKAFGVSFGFELAFLGLLLVPILFAVANIADKFLVHGDGDDSQPGTIQALGGLFSIIFMVPMGLWVLFAGKSLGDWNTFILIVTIEGLQIYAMFLYLNVIKDENPSRIAPWWQIIPIYGAFMGMAVLDEYPTMIEWTGIVAVIVGGVVVSYKKGGFSTKTVGLMLVATMLISVYEVYFAEFGREIDDISALFISLVGKAFWGLMFLVSRRNRNGFVIALRTKFKFQTITEISCTVADLGLLYFFLVFPVAHVQAVSCLQPLFVLGGVVYLSRFFPGALKDEAQAYSIWQKIIGTTLVVIGGVILAVTLEA